MASDELRNLQQRRAEQKALLDEMLRGKTDEERLIIKQEQRYKSVLNVLKEINEQVRDIQSENKIVVDSLIEQESKLKGLTGIQSSLVNLDRQRIQAQQGLDLEIQESINSIASLNQDLLSMSAEDMVGRELQRESITEQINTLRDSGSVNEDILKNLENQRDIAYQMSSLTEGQKEQLEAQLEAYNSIKKTIGGVFDTLSLITSGPAAGFGFALIGAGYAAEVVGKNIRSFGGFIDSAQISAVGLGLVFDGADETLKSLSKEFGGLEDISFATQLNTNLIATNMGISGEEAASLVGNFARLNGMSMDTATDMISTTKSMAKAAGVPVDQVMRDVAQSTETFAKFGKDGGENIAQAAIYASKLGVSMDTLSGMANNLLDFESSITNELELGAMLGKNINFNRARALAFEGQIGAAVKEQLQQLGGIEEFNKMDPIAKQKAAEALGVSVSELQKMGANLDKLNDDGTIQLSQFEQAYEILKATASGPLVDIAKGIGSLVVAGAQMGGSFAQMGVDVKNMASKIPVLGRLFSSQLPDTSLPLPGPTPPTPTPSPDLGQEGGIMDSLSKIDMNAVLKGAAAMLVVAGAVFVFGKAVQEFMKVSWEAVGMAVVSMLSLVGAVTLLGLGMKVVGPFIIVGAAAMLVVAGAVYVLGKAIQEMATGFGMLGDISEKLSTLTQIEFLPILGLAASLTVLAVALTAVSASGLLALPILAGLGLIAGGLGLAGGDETGAEAGNAKTDELINEIKALRADLNSGKIAVYMDGKKVTASVSRVVDKVGTNSYGLG